MAYNEHMKTKAIRGLVNSGSDLMKNMYDVKIYFPSSTGSPEKSGQPGYPITVRLKSFKIPDVEVGTYEIKYHGISINKPNTELKMERKLSLSFREDAAFELRKRFTAWHAAVVDPVTGGVSNAAQFFGKIEVGTIAGAYFAPTVANDLELAYGSLKSKGTFNGLAGWTFHNVWVSKVGGIDFSTDSADANEITVDFYFMDVDFPQYAENPLESGINWQ